MLRKMVFLEQSVEIAFLYIDQRQAKSLRLQTILPEIYMRMGREAKNTSKKTIETDKEKIIVTPSESS